MIDITLGLVNYAFRLFYIRVGLKHFGARFKNSLVLLYHCLVIHIIKVILAISSVFVSISSSRGIPKICYAAWLGASQLPLVLCQKDSL